MRHDQTDYRRDTIAIDIEFGKRLEHTGREIHLDAVDQCVEIPPGNLMPAGLPPGEQARRLFLPLLRTCP